MKNNFKIIFALLLLSNIAMAQVYNIQNFGAKGDGQTINTKAIQKAIDKCSETGGQVVIPKGVFMSGTLYLKNNVEIHVDAGATLKGSPSFRDYPDNRPHYINAFTYSRSGISGTNKAFIFAERVKNISLTGKGTINGSGDSPEFNLGNDDRPESKRRPCMLLILDCKNIKVTDLTLTNSAYWMQNYMGCDGLKLQRLTIYNQTNYNQDAMDLDAKNVLVEDCNIDVDDDGICFKSHDRYRIPENMIVRNCSIASNCNAIKFGTMSIGGLKNVTITNCIIHKASTDRIRHWQKTLQFIGQPISVISGVALECVDGGVVDNIHISDIKMSDVQTPIFIVLGNRSRKQAGDSSHPKSQLKNIFIKNIVAETCSKMPSSITAYPGTYVQNIHLDNISITTMGGGTLTEAGILLKENTTGYPENRMYGQVYPSSGFFIRHVDDLTANNITLNLNQPDARPALILDDVMNSDLTGLKIQDPAKQTPAIRIINSKKIAINFPELTPDDSSLVQLDQTPEGEVNITRYKNSKQ